MPAFDWSALSSSEFSSLDTEKAIAVLPVAAIEQHGPHLPVSTDLTINEAIISATKAKLAPGSPVLFLPPMPFGRSEEHLDYPGTIALDANTLISVYRQIGESIARAGIKKLLFLNSHGGQIQIVQVVARELRIGQGMLVVGLTWPQLVVPVEIVSGREQRFGIHAGEIETSIMIHILGENYRDKQRQDFTNLFEELADRFPVLTSLGPAGVGWKAQDLNVHGAVGAADAASDLQGAKLLEHTSSRLRTLLEEMADFSMENLKDFID